MKRRSVLGSIGHWLSGKRNGIRPGLRTGSAAGSQESCVVAPLLFACQDRHPAVVIAVVDSPVLLVKLLLLLISFQQTGFGLLGIDAVNGNEVPHQFFVPRSVAAKQDMLDVVAVLAQGLETSKPLDAGFFLVPPDLVAVQAALPAANLAAVSNSLVNGPANTVPLPRWQQVSQAGQPGIGRDRLNA